MRSESFDTLENLLESIRGEQAHGLTMSGFEILRVGVFGPQAQ